MNSTVINESIDALIQPISEDTPAGDPYIYSRQLRESFVTLRKPETPAGDGDSSYRRKPDWDAIVELAETSLRTQTKDIRIVCHLIEAQTRLQNFAGLNAGLDLLCNFVAECWDRCNPPIDDGDIEVRTLPLVNMLDDAQRGICFPNTIRQLPLLGNGSESCSLLDYQKLRSSNDSETKQELADFISATEGSKFKELAHHIDQSLERLDELKLLLDTRLGEQAPALTYLRSAIEECQLVAKEFLPRLTVVESSEQTQSDSSAGDQDQYPVAASNQISQGIQSRQHAYQQLAEVADYLQKIEPHSPIPYLISRAVELGNMPFPVLMKEIVREETILNELRREFGIANVAEE